MVTKEQREQHTPAMLQWNEALSYISATTEIPKHRTAQLHLAAHGIELAFKAHLRAKGYSEDQLLRLRHSLPKIIAACIRTGMDKPSPDVKPAALELLSKAHEGFDFRYAHLYHPPHLDQREWMPIAALSLRAAIPAVADDHAKTSAQSAALNRTMHMRVRRMFPNAD